LLGRRRPGKRLLVLWWHPEIYPEHLPLTSDAPVLEPEDRMTPALTTVGPKLQKLIPLLGSDKAGEVVATARAITRTLKKAGLDLHDLAKILGRGEQPAALDHRVEPVCWVDIPESERPAWLARMSDSRRLSPWEQNFSASILAQVRFRPWSRLSEKQVAVLDRCIGKFIAEARR
jgi:hypothetical protein